MAVESPNACLLCEISLAWAAKRSDVPPIAVEVGVDGRLDEVGPRVSWFRIVFADGKAFAQDFPGFNVFRDDGAARLRAVEDIVLNAPKGEKG